MMFSANPDRSAAHIPFTYRRRRGRAAALLSTMALAACAHLPPDDVAATSEQAMAVHRSAQVALSSRSVPIIHVDGLDFRDLDRNGTLTPYEDWRLPARARAQDLVARMTLEEKAGTTMHGTLRSPSGGQGAATRYDMELLKADLEARHVTSFITRLVVPPRDMAEQDNAIQAAAEKGRFAIPVTISTDPRNHFVSIHGQSEVSTGFSQWPEMLGFAALGDRGLVRHFADVVRHEYRAIGIHQALSPQVDLFTDPRWARGYGGFGSNPQLARSLTEAFVAGMQGGETGLGPQSVLATVKHWVGYGATVNGFDAHNYYGRISRVDDETFPQQIEPFLGAFDAKVAGVMPSYSILEGAHVNGQPLDHVGGAYNRQLLVDLLRTKYGFDGVVLSDWAITADCVDACISPSADNRQIFPNSGRPWGVEQLSQGARFAKAMNAGIDQFGGVTDTDRIVEAVQDGRVSMARLDEAVTRILISKFELGLFDSPFVDAQAAANSINTPEIVAETARVQAEAQVLLKNRDGLLPLKAGTRVFLRGIEPEQARQAGLVPVTDFAQAQIAITRADTPHEMLHPYHHMGSMQHEGRLDFPQDNPDRIAIEKMARDVPVVVALFLDRPAILGALNETASGILANFGVSDEALLAALTGRVSPRGHLPFELPSSWPAVEAQDPAKPDDSLSPLYPFGFGLER